MTHIEPAPTLDLSSFRPAPMPGESPGASKGYTLESLASHATAVAGRQLVGIENLIDRQFKTIRQLQKSIAEVEAKPLIVKRLALQVEQLTRDAQELAHDDTNLETTG